MGCRSSHRYSAPQHGTSPQVGTGNGSQRRFPKNTDALTMQSVLIFAEISADQRAGLAEEVDLQHLPTAQLSLPFLTRNPKTNCCCEGCKQPPTLKGVLSYSFNCGLTAPKHPSGLGICQTRDLDPNKMAGLLPVEPT